MSEVHRSALEGFTAGAARYAQGRPDYPSEIDGWLTGELGLAVGMECIELGAGTGKFTAHLMTTGAGLVVVEPVAEMLKQLRLKYPSVTAKTGLAEGIPMADASVDAVVCAQSFHWFATTKTLDEIRRVLKPGGKLGLVWNVRDESVGWVAAITKLIEPFEADTPRFRSQEWGKLFPAEGFSALREWRFENLHRGSPEQVIVDRTMSVSFISALPKEQQKKMESDLRALIARTPELAGKDMVGFPYKTLAFCCTKVG